jgi:hypothetical protein
MGNQERILTAKGEEESAAAAAQWKGGVDTVQRLLAQPLELVSVVDTRVLERLAAIERGQDELRTLLNVLVQQRNSKDWYTTAEAAQLLGKAEFTVREWCRHGRVHAEKRMSGRGAFPAWVISHQELQRYQREGLLRVQHQA